VPRRYIEVFALEIGLQQAEYPRISEAAIAKKIKPDLSTLHNFNCCNTDQLQPQSIGGMVGEVRS